MTYPEKLRSPLWQKKRLEIFQRDNFSCQNCGNTELTLQVHHVEYLGSLDPWEYPNDMLKTLCEPCHVKEKDRPELEKNLATTFKIRGFLYDDLLALSSCIDLNKDFRKYLLGFIRKFKNNPNG